MGEDYHVYLHSEESNSLASNTAPKEEPMGGAFSVKDFAKRARGFAQSGFSGTINSGIATLSKALPAVAVTVVAVKEADKIIQTGFQHLENYMGNYQYSMEYNNFKTIVGNVINPVGFLKKSLHIEFESRKLNEKQAEYRKLMGERYIGV